MANTLPSGGENRVGLPSSTQTPDNALQRWIPKEIRSLRPGAASKNEPNWKKWGRKDTAPLWQPVALLSGLDPDSLSGQRVDDGFVFRATEKFRELLDLATSSIKAKKLRALYPIHPQLYCFFDVEMPEFLRWARSKKLDIPSQLLEVIGASQVAVGEVGANEKELRTALDDEAGKLAKRLCDAHYGPQG